MASHKTVLLGEAVEALAVKPDGVYVDATFGRGGHSRSILARLGPAGRLIALDRDPAAVAAGAAIADARFAIRACALRRAGGSGAARRVRGRWTACCFDLGVSSPQLDEAERGFSFRADAPLDMRMDPSGGAAGRSSGWRGRVKTKSGR